MSAAVERMAELREQVVTKVEVAGIYIEDGAPRAAAERLRNAASLCDQIADLRDRAIGEGIDL